jgi:hypothetical protein
MDDGPLLGLGGDHPGIEEPAPDRRVRHGDPVGALEVPGDGLAAGVEALIDEVCAQVHDHLDRRVGDRGR